MEINKQDILKNTFSAIQAIEAKYGNDANLTEEDMSAVNQIIDGLIADPRFTREEIGEFILSIVK